MPVARMDIQRADGTMFEKPHFSLVGQLPPGPREKRRHSGRLFEEIVGQGRRPGHNPAPTVSHCHASDGRLDDRSGYLILMGKRRQLMKRHKGSGGQGNHADGCVF